MKRNRLKSIVCLVLAAVLSGGMLCLPVGAAKAEDIPCPKCGSRNLTKIDRMNGYLSYSRVKGDTRLNEAKMEEIKDRVSM